MHHISRLLTTNGGDKNCHAERSRSISSLAICYVRVVYGRLYVILSATKDLKVCTTIHRLRDLEILHSVQNDRVSIQNDNTGRDTIRCHAERSRSISSLAMHYQRCLLSALRRFFVTLRMTLWGAHRCPPPLKTLKAARKPPLVLVPEGS